MKVKAGYKKTEVGTIPDDWEVKSLGAIAFLERGKFTARPRNQPRFFGGDIPFIQTGDVANSMGCINAYAQTLNADGLRVSKLFPRNTMFFTIAANIGDVGIAEFETAATDSLVAISPKSSINRLWLLHMLRSRKSFFESIATHNAQMNISLEKLRPILFAIPSLHEQEAIAETLSGVESYIACSEQLLAKKRLIKRGAMQELVTGKKRLPGFKEKWEKKRLDQTAAIQRGASPRPIDSPIWFDDNSSIGWVRISDVTRSGKYLRKTTQRLSALGIQNSRPVGRGSLIMSICATVGRPIITEIDTCIHDGFVVFDKLQADIHFMFYVLNFIEEDWGKHGQTGSQMNLNTALIKRTEVLFPSREEQVAIASVLSDMDIEADALENKLAKARHIKQGMMQELLTGRIRLQ